MKTWIKNLESTLSKSKLGVWAYSRPYAPIIQREIALAKIGAQDTVLFVGAGPIPFTPMLLVKYSKCRVIALERDQHALNQAKKVLDKTKFSDNIQLLHSDGVGKVNQAYQVVIFALQASPLEQLLKTHAHKNARAIIRRPTDRYVNEYDPTPADATVIDEASHGMRAFGKSQLVSI